METTFLKWKTILSHDFHALAQLERPDEGSRVRHALKEQELGQHCWEAGESLTDAELARLKRELGLSEQQWHAYKSRVWPVPG